MASKKLFSFLALLAILLAVSEDVQGLRIKREDESETVAKPDAGQPSPMKPSEGQPSGGGFPSLPGNIPDMFSNFIEQFNAPGEAFRKRVDQIFKQLTNQGNSGAGQGSTQAPIQGSTEAP